MHIRPYRPDDAAAVAAIFFESVREAGPRDYSAAQVAAWAPERPDTGRVDARARDGRLMLVAVDERDRPIAYGDLEPSGHIDHLYCRPERVGTGVASALYDALEREALALGLSRLFVEASEAARRLFLRKGFDEIERREFPIRGVMIHNYRMAKSLAAWRERGPECR
jgi:putative acetyltransferase